MSETRKKTRAAWRELAEARPDLVAAAVDWALCCDWAEYGYDPGFMLEMSPAAVLRGVEREYGGGLAALAADSWLPAPW